MSPIHSFISYLRFKTPKFVRMRATQRTVLIIPKARVPEQQYSRGSATHIER